MALAAGVHAERYPGPLTLPAHLHDVFDRLEVQHVIDVGAHEGEYGRLLRRHVGYESTIHSFEPSAGAFAALEKTAARDPRWRATCLALGTEDSPATLNVYASSSRLNSLHPPSEFGAMSWNLEQSGVESVEVCRLDGIVDGHVPRDRPFFLKIDTQGHDMAVVDGASGCLDRVAGLQLEVAVIPLYEDVPILPDVLRRVGALGFELSGVFPVTRTGQGLKGSDGLRLVEVDCVFVRL